MNETVQLVTRAKALMMDWLFPRGTSMSQSEIESALLAIDPPEFSDVRRLLPPEEWPSYFKALGDAIEAHGKGDKLFGLWRLDNRYLSYEVLIAPIRVAERTQALLRQSEAEYDQFVREVNRDISRLKEDLLQQKKPEPTYPPALGKYLPHTWCHLVLPPPDEVRKWIRSRVEQVLQEVPDPLARLVSWKPKVKKLALPQATYEVSGVPCLRWRFDFSLLVSVDLELVSMTETKVFCGYEYPLVMEGEKLGSLDLDPVPCGRREGFITPLALLALLSKGQVEGDGIQVSKKDGSSISFLVTGYDGEVTISTRFRAFIIDLSKDKPLADALLGAGVIDNLTARLVQQKMSALSPPATAGVPAGDDTNEVEAALEVMGYREREVRQMIQRAQLAPGMSIEDKVKEVLKYAQ